MKLNKFLLGISIFAVLALFAGCASTDDSVKEVVFDSEDDLLKDSVDPQDENIDASNSLVVSSDDASSFQIEATATAGRESKKNYTGWVSSSMRPITAIKGDVKLYANPKKGTFSIFVLNDNEKAIPVVSSANEYTTTSFYLRAGKKIIKLCDDSSVVSAAKKTEKGLKIRYTIEKVAIVMIDFECFSSKEGEAEDTVKITASVMSQAKKKTDFSVKLLLDTVLGETDRHHFYTSKGLPVKNEALYHSMDDEKWFASKNAKACMQVILNGSDVTPIETVALANFATLDTKKWESDMTTFRSFDTVLSYNNSAVGICWPKKNLAPNEVNSEIFYISLAADGIVPGGADYICAIANETAEEAPAETEEAAPQAEPEKQETVQNIQAVKEEPVAPPPPVKETPKETVAAEPEPQPQPQQQKPQNVPAVQEIGKDRLSYDYIQKLLDKIEQLQEGDPDVNKDEINLLNAELDAILNILNAR